MGGHEAKDQDSYDGEDCEGCGEIFAYPETAKPRLKLSVGDVGLAAHDPQLVQVTFRHEGIAEQRIEGRGPGTNIDAECTAKAGNE